MSEEETFSGALHRTAASQAVVEKTIDVCVAANDFLNEYAHTQSGLAKPGFNKLRSEVAKLCFLLNYHVSRPDCWCGPEYENNLYVHRELP